MADYKNLIIPRSYNEYARRDEIIPIGFVYIQFPGEKAPATLFGFGTWTELNFGGAFFRSNSGTMNNTTNTKPSSPEAARLPNIKGKIDGSHMNQWGQFLADAATLTITGPFSVHRSLRYSIAEGPTLTEYVDTIEFDASKANSTYGDGYEVSPKNYTIKIWKRTA